MTRSHVMILAVGHREKLQAGGHGGFSLIPTGFVSWCGLGAALVGTLQVFSLPSRSSVCNPKKDFIFLSWQII